MICDGIRELSSPTWRPVAEMEKSGTIFAKSWCPAVGHYPGRWFSARHYEWSEHHGEWRETDHGCTCIRDDDAYRWVAIRLPPDPPPPAVRPRFIGSGQKLADAHSKNPPEAEHG